MLNSPVHFDARHNKCSVKFCYRKAFINIHYKRLSIEFKFMIECTFVHQYIVFLSS